MIIFVDHCLCLMKIVKTIEIKYLGLIMDEKVNWKLHTTSLMGKIGKIIYQFILLKTSSHSNSLKWFIQH